MQIQLDAEAYTGGVIPAYKVLFVCDIKSTHRAQPPAFGSITDGTLLSNNALDADSLSPLRRTSLICLSNKMIC